MLIQVLETEVVGLTPKQPDLIPTSDPKQQTETADDATVATDAAEATATEPATETGDAETTTTAEGVTDITQSTADKPNGEAVTETVTEAVTDAPPPGDAEAAAAGATAPALSVESITMTKEQADLACEVFKALFNTIIHTKLQDLAQVRRIT